MNNLTRLITVITGKTIKKKFLRGLYLNKSFVAATILMQLFLIVGVNNLTAQELKFTEWEKQSFLRTPPEEIMDVAGIKSGMVIGEVGAGYGRITLHLACRIGSSGKIYANDINDEALDSLKKRCKRAGLNNVEIVLGQVDDPLFPEESLDIAIMVWTYHWLENPVTFLRNLMPALKQDAQLVLVEPDPVRGPGGKDHGVSVERMKAEAKASGFELLRTETFLPEDLVFILRKRK